jgi:hypothetical protein
MTQKKISGYTIFLEKLLGKGSYGSVLNLIFRSTKELKMELIFLLLSKSSKKKIVFIIFILVDSDEYMKAALLS